MAHPIELNVHDNVSEMPPPSSTTIERRFNPGITLRGLIISLLAAWLLLGPVYHESDIIASVVGYSLVATIGIFLFVTIALGRSLRPKALPILSLPSIDGAQGYPDITPDAPVSISLKTPAIHLPPCYTFDIDITFEHRGAPPLTYRVTGNYPGSPPLFQPVRFPHRGIWTATRAVLTLGDQFGLTSFSWIVGQHLLRFSVPVHPPRTFSQQLPVLSSSHRTGDDAIDVHERHGEHFDIKRYHPADGMKKILWKIFARRGELLSRHPEPSMTPEGQVVIYTLAGREDDHVCGEVLAYIRQLEELNLQIFFGCEGMPHDEPVRSSESAEELLMESVWATGFRDPGSLSGTMAHFIESARKEMGASRLTSLLLFVSTGWARDRESRTALEGIAEVVEREGIKPVFFFAPLRSNYATALAEAHGNPRGIRSGFQRFFFTGSRHIEHTAPGMYREFLSTCAYRNWEVITTA